MTIKHRGCGAELVRANALTLPLRDASVDLIVTSPPYFALRSYQDDGEHYDAGSTLQGSKQQDRFAASAPVEPSETSPSSNGASNGRYEP